MPRWALRHAGLALALLFSAAAAGHQLARQRVGYTRYDLPSFDAYAYMTMADEPAFFTAAPWGYRVLGPRLVHLFRPRDRLVAFRDLAYWSVVGCGGVLYLFLRRLGHGVPMALAGVLAFSLSRPVHLALGAPMLGEPLAALLQIGALLAVAAGAGPLALAALLALGVLAKELFLLMPPLLLLARLTQDGLRRALRASLAAAAPALAVLLALHLWWTPQLRTPRAPLDLALLRAGLEVLGLDWYDTARALLLTGITPLALLGALLPESRAFLRVYGYLALLCLVLSLVAWVNVPSATPVPLFGANTERLLLYALPLLIPLALRALERGLRLAPAVAAAPGAAAPARVWPRALALTALSAALLLPFLGTERYRRLPLHEPRDGPLLMAFCQESLRTARRLERGEEVAFDPERMRFAWGIDDPGRLFEMRWFLREGWGPLAHYGIHDVVMREPRATLVLPCLTPRALHVTLSLEAPQPSSFQAFLNGAAVGRVSATPERTPSPLLVPAAALVRGDNLLTLSAVDGAPPGTRLRGLTLRSPR
jgi:hypothetical protein